MLPDSRVGNQDDSMRSWSALTILTVLDEEGNRSRSSRGWHAVGDHSLAGLSALQVPGDVDDDDPPSATQQKDRFQQVGSAIVKEIVPPVADDECGHKHAYLAHLCVALHLEDVVDHRLENLSKGRIEDQEFRNALDGGFQRFGNGSIPVFADLVGLFGGLHVYAADVIG